MQSIVVKNGDIVSGGCVKRGDILIENNKIVSADFHGSLPENCKVIDASRCYVSPGFIDIHLHGGGGFDFMDCTPEALKGISDIHLMHGTTLMVPTAVTSPFESILKLFEVYRSVQSECPNFYGIHLEGPYISPAQKGAHKEYLLHSPNDAETDALLRHGEGILKKITAAPELEGMERFARRMTEAGVRLCLGHSDATFDVAMSAFRSGFSHVTHLYSATPSVRKINQKLLAGVVEAAYVDDAVTVELIADGKHAAVGALQLAVKIKGTDKVALVSDALRPAGTNVTESYIGECIPENRVIIEDGVAKLPDRSSFAGSIATSDMLLERGVNHYGFSVADTVRMMTETPAKTLGIKNKGRIADGFDADIVIFDKDLAVNTVILGGSIVRQK